MNTHETIQDNKIVLIEGQHDYEVAYSFARRFNYPGNFQNYTDIKSLIEPLCISNFENLLTPEQKAERFNTSQDNIIWNIFLRNAIFLIDGKPYSLYFNISDNGYSIFAEKI